MESAADARVTIAVSAPIQVGGARFSPEQLAAIADAAGPDADIEMTPFRQMYVKVADDRRESAEAALRRAGLEVNAAGFTTKSLIACQFCKGEAEAGLAAAQALNRAIAGIPTPTPMKIGYAGCALGTSEPLYKDIGVVKMRSVFDIYVGGEPKGLKTTAGRLLVAGVEPSRLVEVVLSLIGYYVEHAKGKEKFAKFVDRVTLDRLREAAG